jgi:putative colanic acid biosynthesis UDP-glucose lipid carrier transferase
LRGETDTVDKMAERVRYDLEYLRNWSPWLDLRILTRSLSVVWSDYKSAY